MQLAVSTDLLVCGTLFLADPDPEDLGWKTLAVNVSDLAAMGAEPRWAFLALALPAVDEAWIEAFARGLFACADAFGVDLAGGDTTRGPLNLALTIIGEVGANGCNYQVMEFTGEGAKTLTISDRIALCNMAVEAGAKTGIFEVDDVAMEYLKEHGREPKAVYHSDPDAHYVREYTFDLSKVEPVVAKPDFVDNLAPAKDVRGIKIDEAFLGSCNNGRIEDLRVGAQVIKGKKVSEKVRFLVVPASQTIYRQALEEGLIDIFMDAGAIVMNPNCSVCWGSCQGVIGENEVLISTGTRNFKGRAGHPSSKVYLGSAATVTASAIAGEIALASDV